VERLKKFCGSQYFRQTEVDNCLKLLFVFDGKKNLRNFCVLFHLLSKKDLVCFRELNPIDYHCIFEFFPARQVFEIILNESSMSLNVLIEWLRKDKTKFFTKTRVYVVSLMLSLVFKTVFGIFLAALKKN
jgi:hypothetical protein